MSVGVSGNFRKRYLKDKEKCGRRFEEYGGGLAFISIEMVLSYRYK